ncbi:MAG: Electron transfer flavoprotein subunit alpha [Alphaproteobacteria bacterium MarineAlpha5_Bin12]|nr:MAG: Electron transfer flavoprotein subunit alpha [Alphaproteobacteria bacterium MarineAlpha5_Bin12]|tara:strand:+ start:2179 stop:3129 length:951 start_codon:yes stop_codon:yes gene_type:complete
MILVIAEHNNEKLKSFTLNTVEAASKINEEIHILIAGNNSENVCNEASSIKKVKKVLHAKSSIYENHLCENLTPLIVNLAKNYSHIISPATAFGKNLMPRVAALLDVSQISDIIEVESEDTFIRPIYAGNAIAKVKSNDIKKVITIRPTSFEPTSSSGGSAIIEDIGETEDLKLSNFVSKEESKSERPELGTARIVVSGGRGLQSSENFKLITDLADKLNAAVGASRAAVDAGYVGNDFQVGQTGKVVVPELYIAIGISGAIQHLAGMKESKVIVAINKDDEAPIFNVADYGLKADLFEAIPALKEELAKLNIIKK